jgi:hypothetical protein
MSKIRWSGVLRSSNAEFVREILNELLVSRTFAVVRVFVKLGQPRMQTGHALNNPPFVESFDDDGPKRFELVLPTSLGDLEYSYSGHGEEPIVHVFDDHAIISFTDDAGRRVSHMLILTG